MSRVQSDPPDTPYNSMFDFPFEQRARRACSSKSFSTTQPRSLPCPGNQYIQRNLIQRRNHRDQPRVAPTQDQPMRRLPRTHLLGLHHHSTSATYHTTRIMSILTSDSTESCRFRGKEHARTEPPDEPSFARPRTLALEAKPCVRREAPTPNSLTISI